MSVSPVEASLFMLEPGNTVQLAVAARDQNGRLLFGGTPTYTSSDLMVAQVSADGEVRAVGLGSAQITVTLTLSGTTRSAAMTVLVIPRPDEPAALDYSGLSGTYDFDVDAQGWEGADGARFTATLRFDGSASGSRVIGSFTSLLAVRPDGGQLLGQPLTGRIYLDRAGANHLELVLASDSSPTRRFELYVKDIGAPQNGEGSPHFAGLFWMEDFYMFGDFTAVRRSN